MLADGPQFLPGQASRVYTWAGQHSVINCYVHAEPTPLLNWFVKGIKLENNETFHIVSSGTNSSLEVGNFSFCSICMKRFVATTIRNILNTNDFYASTFCWIIDIHCAGKGIFIYLRFV